MRVSISLFLRYKKEGEDNKLVKKIHEPQQHIWELKCSGRVCSDNYRVTPLQMCFESTF